MPKSDWTDILRSHLGSDEPREPSCLAEQARLEALAEDFVARIEAKAEMDTRNH